MDPSSIETVAEFAHGLNALRGGRSYAALSLAAKRLPAGRGGPRHLPSSTLSDLLGGRSVPSRETVAAYLAACGLDPAAGEAWLAARDRVANVGSVRPAGAVRVRDAQPRLLGVHAAIRVAEHATELPPYVERDFDPALRAAVTAASARSGLVLLVGGSSAGKTRSLFEAVTAALPDWWLAHPADDDEIRALAALPARRTVVWLDELQRFLAAAPAVHQLSRTTLVVATLWPQEYLPRIVPGPAPTPTETQQRRLLDAAAVIDVPDRFGAAELARARALAGDARIRVALGTDDGGLTQVLAAGPALVRWWEHAPDPYAKATITAALDVRRLGARRPVSRELLAQAAPAYLDSAHLATAPAGWLDGALAYASSPLHGAAASLSPVAARLGRIAGYAVADYLHQHALRVRRDVQVPDAVWDAIVRHHDPTDTSALAASALSRARHRQAAALYRRAAAAGDPFAEAVFDARITPLLPLDELREEALAGNVGARRSLILRLGELGMIDELIGVAAGWLDRDDTGFAFSAVLADHHRVDDLRRFAGSGCPGAAMRLADLLVEQGRVDELLQRATAGDQWAAGKLPPCCRPKAAPRTSSRSCAATPAGAPGSRTSGSSPCWPRSVASTSWRSWPVTT